MIMSYHRAFNKSNTTDVTNEAGHACPSGPELDFTPCVLLGSCCSFVVLSAVFFRPSFAFLSFFILIMAVSVLLPITTFGHHFVIFWSPLCYLQTFLMSGTR